jgi:hypothetical protein
MTFEKPSMLSAVDLKSFLRYTLQFSIQNGHLYWKGKRGRHQKVLWDAEPESVLKGVHEKLEHKGVLSTRKALLDRAWWPEVYSDVVMWVRQCFCSDMSGNKKIELARDNTTGCPEGRMLRKATMMATARFPLEVISCWGAIKQITTENSPKFGAAIDKLGVVEKGHHPFRTMPLKACREDPSAWENHFYHAPWVDCATVRKAKGCSPFEAAHGYPPLLSIDALYSTFAWDMEPMTAGKSTLARLRMIEKGPEDKTLVLEQVARSCWRNKERFEKEYVNTPFRGDAAPETWVSVRDTAIKKEKNHKHKPRWPGPLIVVETRPQTEADILVEPGGTVLLMRFATFRSIPYRQREGLTFRLDELLKPVQVDEVVEVEENKEPREAEPEEKTEKSEEELTCAKIGEYWERLTGVDGRTTETTLSRAGSSMVVLRRHKHESSAGDIVVSERSRNRDSGLRRKRRE